MFTDEELNTIAGHYDGLKISTQRSLKELDQYISTNLTLSDDILQHLESIRADYANRINLYDSIACKAYKIPY